MKKFVLLGLLFAVGLALLLAPFASQFPDGLEKVAEEKGFLDKGEGKEVFHSPIRDYLLPGIKNEKFATGLAGVIGTVLVFILVYGLSRLLYHRKKFEAFSENTRAK